MNQQRNWFTIALFTLLILSTTVYARTDTTFNQLLSKIKTYDYGQSREHLTRMEKYIRTALDSPDELKAIQSGMISYLESDATFAGKQFICQQLSIIGDEDAVPALTTLLREQETADIARYALERIPGEEVDVALRKELARSKGAVQIGIINTLGQRGDNQSVKAIEKLVDNQKPEIAAAAITALGNIGNENSAKILEKSIQTKTGDLKKAALDSYLKCADRLASKGELEKALVIYDHLFGREFPQAIRSAALRGKVKTEKSGDTIINILSDQDELPSIRADAISLIDELPQSVNMDRFARELQRLPQSLQIIMLNELADRGDAAAVKEVRKVATAAQANVRMAAYKALAVLGNESDIDILISAATKTDRNESEVARESLYRLQGEKVDETILSKIPAAEGKAKVELIAAIDQRLIQDTTPLLLDLAKHENRRVRAASFKSLGTAAEPVHFPEILNLLKNASSKSDRTRLERTLVAVAHKFPETKSPSEVILSEITDVKDIEIESSLIKVLGVIGEPQALPVLRIYLTDEDSNIRIAAIYAMSDYPTPEPLDDLLEIARSSPDEVHRILALRGYIRLLGLESDRPQDTTIELYLKAMELAENIQEKRMVLSGLSKVYTMRSFETVVTYLDDSALRPEAEVAALELAKKVGWRDPVKTKAVLKDLIDSTENEQLKIEARELLIKMSR